MRVNAGSGLGNHTFLELVKNPTCFHGNEGRHRRVDVWGEGVAGYQQKLPVGQGVNKLLAKTDGHRHQSISCI